MRVNMRMFILKPDQVSLAIGREGSKYQIGPGIDWLWPLMYIRDNEGEEEEFDIDLEEFSDEIETWIIDELKRMGCDTAKKCTCIWQRKNWNAEQTWKRETIDEVRKILKEEFEKE